MDSTSLAHVSEKITSDESKRKTAQHHLEQALQTNLSSVSIHYEALSDGESLSLNCKTVRFRTSVSNILKTIVCSIENTFEDYFPIRKEYGFASQLMFGHVVYQTEQNERKISVPLMLKNMLHGTYCPDYIDGQYFNEIHFYTRALPFLQQFGNLQKLLPKFYDSYIHSGSGFTKFTIISEDLKAQGYRDYKRLSFLDLEHLTLMFRTIGQFHSYSYFAKSTNAREFRALGNWFKYPQAELIHRRPNYFRFFSQIGLQRLRQDLRYGSHIARVEKAMENADALMMKWNLMEQDEPMSVLCHGDYLKGNVMFRYEDGQLVDMKIIDMATCRIASPVMDLSLVLYLNVHQQTRNRHWNRLIDAYYEGLCQPFGGVGVPSKESILEEFTDKAINGYLIASHFSPDLIGMEIGISSYYTEYFAPEFIGRPLSEIPENAFKDMINRWCSEDQAEALADILRDLIDRHFI